MKCYLVGGVVRDELLGRKPRDRDWVVTGSTPQAMLDAGYRSVAKGMPVFVDPKTGEQFALARLERKSGTGHKGFQFTSSPQVRLEDDLRRRDLTINAMARDDDGRMIDPCGGRRDLQHRLLKHVSDAFIEDPLRVFRVARFAAELHEYGFSVAPETLQLMRRMAASGELASLPAERVWNETLRALESPSPRQFFAVLQGCDALGGWFAELVGQLRLDTLEQAAAVPPPWRWAGLLWQMQAEPLAALHGRLKPPKAFTHAARLAQSLLPLLRTAAEATTHPTAREDQRTAGEMRYDILRRADAFRRPQILRELLQLHRCLGDEPPADWWLGALQAALDADAGIPRPPDSPQAEYARCLQQQRINALQRWQ